MKLFFLCFSCLFISGVSISQNTDDDAIFKNSKKDNLMTVVDHYRITGDKEKYQAAIFLINNIEAHKSYNYKWIDQNKNTIPFSELEYATYEESFEVLEKLKDSLNLKPLNYIEQDVDVILPKTLIKNIDQAFFEWRNNPWSKSYDFQTFCEYILPYRSLVEPLSISWRKSYRPSAYKGAQNALDINDPVDVATNTILELSNYKFVNKTPDPVSLLSPEQLLFRKSGTCANLANLALFACRSIGLAVTFDFTPHWAASSNRHFWNTIVSSEGKHIPFNGKTYGKRNDLPLLYNPNYKRMGKVYRQTFSIQAKALATHTKANNIPEGFLRNKCLLDVTNEYVDVGEIRYRFKEDDTAQFAFLNVFNLAKWHVIDWAKSKNGSFKFKNVGTNLVYLPSKLINNKTLFGKYPVLLDESKNQFLLKPDFNNPFEVTLSRNNEIKNQYKDYNTLDIEEDKYYLLLYWAGRWKKLGVSKATKNGVHFKSVPKNALFRLLPKQYDKFERIFTIDEATKNIVWY